MFISPEIKEEKVQAKDWNLPTTLEVGAVIPWKKSPTGKAEIQWIQFSYFGNAEGNGDLEYVKFEWIS